MGQGRAGAQTRRVWQHGLRGSRTVTRLLVRSSPPARLIAATVCLLAAGAAVMSAACFLTVRGYLMRQAEQQLRAYAGDLADRPFTMFPASPVPGVAGVGGPGGTVSLEVRDSEGQLVMSAGPDPRAVSGGSWLATAEPIRFRAQRILFAYGADDYSVTVTGKTRPGLAGTLLVRLSLASVGRTVDGITAACLAVSGAAVLLVGWVAAVVIWAILRPLTQTEASARATTERMGQAVADTACQLRTPVQVLHGIADYYPQRARLSAGESDRLMRQVADEAVRIDTLIDDLVRLQAAQPHDGPG
jgi:signal transduction histidine kinase